jgi:thymidylate synthase
MNNVQEQYKGLLSSLVHGGKQKNDRTGVGTRSVFGRILRHDMSAGFPLLTTKKIYFNHAVTEILWILQGRSDIGYLNDNGLTYWNADYERSGKTDGTLGPVYGVQWRNFNGVDQITKLIREIKKNPSSRRLMVNAWNAADLDDMALPPCHYGFQVYINDGKMDLMWNQRSADVFLGLPYDLAMYGLLLLMLAKGTNYIPGQLIVSLGDCHLYNNHINQAKEQLSRNFRKLPNVSVDWGLDVMEGAGGFLRIPTHKMINISGYEPHPPIKADLNVGPMVSKK